MKYSDLTFHGQKRFLVLCFFIFSFWSLFKLTRPEVVDFTWDKKALISRLHCTTPLPKKETVDSGLSFYQTRTCSEPTGQHQCYNYLGDDYTKKRVCLDAQKTITFSNIEIGTKVTK